MFFSAAYFAAASLTMGAIMESSAVIQSDAIFHFLPSQVWICIVLNRAEATCHWQAIHFFEITNVFNGCLISYQTYHYDLRGTV